MNGKADKDFYTKNIPYIHIVQNNGKKSVERFAPSELIYLIH